LSNHGKGASRRPADKPRKPNTEVKATPKTLTPEEQAERDAELELVKTFKNRPKLERAARFKGREGEPHILDPDGCMDVNAAKLIRDFGVKDVTLVARLTHQVGYAIPQREMENLPAITNANLAAIQEIGPRDGVEALLATQMVSVHNMAMEHLRRLAIDQPHYEVANSIANRTTKLLRTFSTQVETLNRYRNAGKQVITVNHIGQVNAENAAIAVGCTTGQPGGSHENNGEPHDRNQNIIEHFAVSSLAPVSSHQQANGQAVPMCGDGERGLLSSRRQEPRRALRKSP